MSDRRTLQRTKTPGIYRRHAESCHNGARCGCPYVVVWKSRGRQHKQLFASYELAREHKGKMTSGTNTRRSLSPQTVADYYDGWFPRYRGRTSRGLEQSTRSVYEISFRHHILPTAIARIRMRDLGAPEIREWFGELEERGATPTVIRRAKRVLSVMLACAVEDGEIMANPATGVRYVPSEQAKRAHPKTKRRALSADDVQASWSHAGRLSSGS
jgi:hypothetical protein